MDPSCTELAPVSALGHSNIKMQVSGSARTSPFICFGAHQYPNSNMSNVLTQYLTLVGTTANLIWTEMHPSGYKKRLESKKHQDDFGFQGHPAKPSDSLVKCKMFWCLMAG